MVTQGAPKIIPKFQNVIWMTKKLKITKCGAIKIRKQDLETESKKEQLGIGHFV